MRTKRNWSLLSKVISKSAYSFEVKYVTPNHVVWCKVSLWCFIISATLKLFVDEWPCHSSVRC